MALAPQLPPDPLDSEKLDYETWFGAAMARLRSSETTPTYDSLVTLINEGYERLSISQSEGGGVPSPSSFARLAPVLRKMRLNQLTQGANELEETMIGFLHTIPKENARKLIGQLMLGRPTGDFFDQLEDLGKSLSPEMESPPLVPGAPEEGPTPPNRHYRKKLTAREKAELGMGGDADNPNAGPND